MTYEDRNQKKGGKEFYREAVNAVAQYRYLLKDPGRKLSNYFASLRGSIILCAGLLVLNAAVSVAWGGNTLSYVGMALMAILILLCAAYLVNLNKARKKGLFDRIQRDDAADFNARWEARRAKKGPKKSGEYELHWKPGVAGPEADKEQ